MRRRYNDRYALAARSGAELLARLPTQTLVVRSLLDISMHDLDDTQYIGLTHRIEINFILPIEGDWNIFRNF